MERETWLATVRGVAQIQIGLRLRTAGLWKGGQRREKRGSCRQREVTRSGLSEASCRLCT